MGSAGLSSVINELQKHWLHVWNLKIQHVSHTSMQLLTHCHAVSCHKVQWVPYISSLHDAHHGEEDHRQQGGHSQRHTLCAPVQSHEDDGVATFGFLWDKHTKKGKHLHMFLQNFTKAISRVYLLSIKCHIPFINSATFKDVCCCKKRFLFFGF